MASPRWHRWLRVVGVAVLGGVATVSTGGVGRISAVATSSYQALIPQRVVDTRIGLGVPTATRVSGGAATPITFATVPNEAAAVAFNLTVTDAVGDGYAAAFPCGQDPPLSSNVNFHADQTTANLVIAKPGVNGQVCVVTNVAVDLVVDLQGWFPPGAYDPLPTPERVLDTRIGGTGQLVAGVESTLVNDGSGGIVVANVTIVQPSGPGYLTVFPCGTTPATTSNVNFDGGSDVANLVVTLAGAGGVCAVASVSTDVVVDVQGHVPADGGYTAITPVRMFDTRSPIGVPTAQRLLPGQTTAMSFPVKSGIPASADTAIVNVAATNSLESGYVTLYPCGQAAPLASNLNIMQGETHANLVISRLGPGGTICLTSNVAVDVVVDLQGWFATSAAQPAVSDPTREHVDITAGLSMGYLAFLPAGYWSSPGRTWPTIVFLHGALQAGSGTGASLDSVVFNGLALLMQNGTEPAVASQFVVLIPQSPTPIQSVTRLHTWLSQVLPRYSIDRDRVYLTGLSAGGFATFKYLATYGDANEFAAMVPITGGYGDPILCANWQHTPLWAFHGEADSEIALSVNSVTYVNAHCDPSEPLKLTTYPGVGHNSYDRTYDLSGMAPGQTNPTRDPYEPDIYTWMLEHTRSQTR